MSDHVSKPGFKAAAPPKPWLERAIPFQPAERGRLFQMMALSFCLSSSTVMVETTTSALFLARFGAGQLPYIYILSAIAIASSGLLLTRLRSTLSLHRLLGGLTTFIFVVTAALWAGLTWAQISWMVFASLLWYHFVKVGAELTFWSLANYIFNIQEAKRLFGPISTGEAVAQIIGYFLTPLISLYLGITHLLALAVILYGAAVILIFVIMRGRSASVARAQAANTQPEPALDVPRPTRYILLIFGLIAAGYLNYYFIGFTFYSATAQSQFSADASYLASFLGIIFGVAAIFSLVAKAVLSGRSLQRFGLGPNLIVRPVAALILALLVLAADRFATGVALVFGLVVILRLLDSVLYAAIYRASSLLLYQPLSINRRLTVLSLSESVVGPFSIGLVGVLLLVLGRNALEQHALFVVGNAVLWIGLILAVTRLYPNILQNALQRRQLQGGNLTLNDATSLAAVRDRLDSPYPGEAIYALHVLERADAPDLASIVGQLLRHPHPAARGEAVERAESLALRDLLPDLRRMMVADEAPVRAAATRAVAALEGDAVLEELDSFLRQQNLTILRAGLTGLLRNGTGATRQWATAWLSTLAQGSVAERVVAAQVVADFASPALLETVVPLLDDPVPGVRRAAILAVGSLADRDLPPTVLDHLLDLSRDPNLGNTVVQALSKCGAPLLDRVQARFHAPASTRREQVNMVQIAGRMQIPTARQWLLSLVDAPSSDVRGAALSALNRQKDLAAETLPDQLARRVRAQLAVEVKEAGRVLAALDALSTLQEEPELLKASLNRLMEGVRHRIFWLLGLVHNPHVMAQVRENLGLASRERQAYALEILDITLKSETKALLLPVLDPAQPAQQLAQLAQRIPLPRLSSLKTIEQIARGETEPFTPWLQACALFEVGRQGLAQLYNAAFAAQSSQDSLVIETAQWAVAVLNRHREGQEDADPAQPLNREQTMLLTIEKALILRSVSLFENTPDEVLAQVARLVEEVYLSEGQTIFEKGDYGDSLYIVVQGKVRVHEGETLFNYLHDRDLFGEMAVLEPEPRSASVTAESDTHLLRLSRETLFELIEARPEVAHGIIRGLSGHLRGRLKDIKDLRQQLADR